MVNHFWDGLGPVGDAFTACGEYMGETVQYISSDAWSIVSCPGCLEEKPERLIWADERADVLNRFTEELAKATSDGSRKRQAGAKPAWYEDDSHEGAMFSHLTKWKRGELIDADSGAHPLVHLAWRALAIACRESGNVPLS